MVIFPNPAINYNSHSELPVVILNEVKNLKLDIHLKVNYEILHFVQNDID